MVAVMVLFRKRRNVDTNDINFVTDSAPIGEDSSGFPLFREITSPDFVQSGYATNFYKKVSTDDTYGFYDTFLFRPGIRKIIQDKLTITVEQKQNTFTMPLYVLGLFGVRIVAYDEATQTVIPTTRPYQLASAKGSVNHGEVITYEFSARGTTPASLVDMLEAANLIPPPIDFSAGGSYKRNVVNDTGYISNWRHDSTAQAENTIFTTHVIDRPLIAWSNDQLNLPPGFALQFKAQTYVFRLEYPPHATNSLVPVLRLIDADDIITFSGHFDAM
jgi:hypothetical protein